MSQYRVRYYTKGTSSISYTTVYVMAKSEEEAKLKVRDKVKATGDEVSTFKSIDLWA